MCQCWCHRIFPRFILSGLFGKFIQIIKKLESCKFEAKASVQAWGVWYSQIFLMWILFKRKYQKYSELEWLSIFHGEENNLGGERNIGFTEASKSTLKSFSRKNPLWKPHMWKWSLFVKNGTVTLGTILSKTWSQTPKRKKLRNPFWNKKFRLLGTPDSARKGFGRKLKPTKLEGLTFLPKNLILRKKNRVKSFVLLKDGLCLNVKYCQIFEKLSFFFLVQPVSLRRGAKMAIPGLIHAKWSAQFQKMKRIKRKYRGAHDRDGSDPYPDMRCKDSPVELLRTERRFLFEFMLASNKDFQNHYRNLRKFNFTMKIIWGNFDFANKAYVFNITDEHPTFKG